MGLSYDTRLIDGADIVTLTGVQDLARLSADGELDLDAFALSAHRAIYRRLEGAGIDPTLLTNGNRLEDAVAYEACERLALAGYISGDASSYAAKVVECMRSFRPEYSTDADAPRNAGEGVPVVGHINEASMFSGTGPFGEPSRYFGDDFPEDS